MLFSYYRDSAPKNKTLTTLRSRGSSWEEFKDEVEVNICQKRNWHQMVSQRAATRNWPCSLRPRGKRDAGQLCQPGKQNCLWKESDEWLWVLLKKCLKYIESWRMHRGYEVERDVRWPMTSKREDKNGWKKKENKWKKNVTLNDLSKTGRQKVSEQRILN